MYQLPVDPGILGLSLRLDQLQYPDLLHSRDDADARNHRTKFAIYLDDGAAPRLHDQSTLIDIDQPRTPFCHEADQEAPVPEISYRQDSMSAIATKRICKFETQQFRHF
ncbi:MAG: hypothetical protein ABSC06_06745 [Rhodopila sp.]